MKRHSAKPLYKSGFWDLGGSLNEISPPSEFPERDKLECINWKVHKDGKSMVKRPGYGSRAGGDDGGDGEGGSIVEGFTNPGESIIQVHNYEDENGETKTLIITEHKIIMRKDVLGYSLKYDDSYETAYDNFKPFVYNGKILILESNTDLDDTICKASADGETWTTLFETTGEKGNQYSAQNILTEFNNHLFFSLYGTDPTPKVVEWDGESFTDHLDEEGKSSAICFLRWDGNLWVILDSSAGRRVVYYYNGTNWAAITDYDTATYLDYNIASYHPSGEHNYEAIRFFTWKGNLYLMTANYDDVGEKWAWEIWKFKKSSYDQFNKIYDSDEFEDGYGGTLVFKENETVYVMANTLSTNGRYFYKPAKLYKATRDDLTTWEEVGSFASFGVANHTVTFNNRIYVQAKINDAGGANRYTKIWAFNKNSEDFTLETTIITEKYTTRPGAMCIFNGELYVGKVLEVYKRVLSENSWTDVYYTEEASPEPPAMIDEEGRVIISNVSGEQNLIVEGESVYGLGISPPGTALTAEASEEEGLPDGKYRYVVTFYRSGNYPCESNPSPESAVWEEGAEKKIINLTAIPVSSDPKVNARRIYRTTAGGAVFFWLHDIEDNSTPTYEDNIADDSLGDEVSYDRGVPKTGKFFEVWDNRLWIAGNLEYPNLLFFTNTGTSEEMADLNFLNIKRRESDEIMQIKAFGDYLYVWKNKSWFRIAKSGTSLYEVKQMPENIGTDASYSPAVCDKFLIWKSEIGIEIYNGITNFRPVPSEKIKRTMKSINKNYLNKCIGGHNEVDGEYWLSVPTGDNTDQDTVIVFDYLRNLFTPYEFPEGLSYFESLKDANENLINLVGTPDGNIYIHSDDYYSDDGTPINSHFKTGWINVTGEREIWNILRRMFIKYIIPETKAITGEVVGAGTGSKKSFSYTALNLPVKTSSVTISYTVGSDYEATDDGEGVITGNGCTGTIVYSTGVIALTFETAPDSDTNVTIDYERNLSITMKIYKHFKKAVVATIQLYGVTPTDDVELRNEVMRALKLGVRTDYVMFEFINNQDCGGECRLIGWDLWFKKRAAKRTVKATD